MDGNLIKSAFRGWTDVNATEQYFVDQTLFREPPLFQPSFNSIDFVPRSNDNSKKVKQQQRQLRKIQILNKC